MKKLLSFGLSFLLALPTLADNATLPMPAPNPNDNGPLKREYSDKSAQILALSKKAVDKADDLYFFVNGNVVDIKRMWPVGQFKDQPAEIVSIYFFSNKYRFLILSGSITVDVSIPGKSVSKPVTPEDIDMLLETLNMAALQQPATVSDQLKSWLTPIGNGKLTPDNQLLSPAPPPITIIPKPIPRPLSSEKYQLAKEAPPPPGGFLF